MRQLRLVIEQLAKRFCPNWQRFWDNKGEFKDRMAAAQAQRTRSHRTPRTTLHIQGYKKQLAHKILFSSGTLALSANLYQDKQEMPILWLNFEKCCFVGGYAGVLSEKIVQNQLFSRGLIAFLLTFWDKKLMKSIV